MLDASYIFCLGKLNNVLHSQFGFGFALTFLYLPRQLYAYLTQSVSKFGAANYSSSVCIRFFLKYTNHAQKVCSDGIMFVFSCRYNKKRDNKNKHAHTKATLTIKKQIQFQLRPDLPKIVGKQTTKAQSTSK